METDKSSVRTPRPLSPHLGIYKPQITSVLSIMHRFTGVGLVFGSWLLALWLMMNAYGCATCVNPLLSTPVAQLFLFAWTFALYYHLLNGIRHLFWDIGKGFDVRVVNRTGVAVVVGTLVLTVLTWIAAHQTVGMF